MTDRPQPLQDAARADAESVPAGAELLARLARAQLVVAHIEKGLAVLRPDGVVYWANDVYREWTGGEPVGRPFLDSLACDRVSVERASPTDHTNDLLAPARAGAP